MYQHSDYLGNVLPMPVGKVVCIGRNYLDHIDEMNSAVPTSPLLFLKPKAALCSMHAPLVVPTDQGECHNELEIAICLINHSLRPAKVMLELPFGAWD